MGEKVTQHIITKGGEFYSRELTRLECSDEFNLNAYMSQITNTPPYNLIQATEDTFVAFDSVLKLWFTRMEVH